MPGGRRSREVDERLRAGWAGAIAIQ
ncbi:hypothetical protein LCGC14_2624660, partial [marine sediment metagenome]